MALKVSLVSTGDRELEDLVRQAAGQVVVGASLQAVLSPAKGDPPHVVVLDIRQQLALPPDLNAIRRSHPLISLVLVVSRLEPRMMLEAMRAGVSEVLSEPLTADDIRHALERVSTLRPAQKQGRLYAFVGAKGGVGTTTAAVNVATALAKPGSGRVLMIDLHAAHGDAALFLGAEARFSILDALENTHRLDEAFLRGLVVHTKSGPDLLASSDRAAESLVDTPRVRSLLDFVRHSYDHVVLDVPRSDAAVLEALDSVAHIVVVANQELATVRGAARVAASMRQRYGKERVQVVVSRYDTAAEIGHEDVERVTGSAVQHLFPSNYRVAVAAMNKGRPLVVENHSQLAASYRGLARSLGGVPQAAEPKAAGLLGRLTGRR